MENNKVLAQILVQLEEQNKLNQQHQQLITALMASEGNSNSASSENAILEQYIQNNSVTTPTETAPKRKINIHFPSLKKEINEKIEPVFTEITKEDIVEEKVETITEPIPVFQPSVEIENKWSKFSNMVATNLVTFGKKHAFIKPNNFSLKNIGDKFTFKIRMPFNITPAFSKLYQGIKNSLIDNAAKAGMLIQDDIINIRDSLVSQYTDFNKNIYDNFFLVGDKRQIAKLNKNFSHALNTVGFSAEDIVTNERKKDFSSVESIASTIEERLENELKLKKENNNYLLPALSDIDDNMKNEIISNLIWPKLVVHLKEALDFSIVISKSKNNNPYFKMIEKFSSKNNLSVESIIHTLQTNPDLLKDYKDFSKIIVQKENIMQMSEKYEVLARNNFVVLQSLVKAATDIQMITNGLEISPEQKAEVLAKMDNTKISMDGDKAYSFSTIQKNVTKLLSNKSFVKEMVSSNTVNKPTVEIEKNLMGELLPNRLRM
jgi:hypothetical protein